MNEPFEIDGHTVTTEGPEYGRQPGWTRWKVHVDGVHVGWLDRHSIPGFGDAIGAPAEQEWLIASPRWDPVGNRSYEDRGAALRALVAHHVSAS